MVPSSAKKQTAAAPSGTDTINPMNPLRARRVTLVPISCDAEFLMRLASSGLVFKCQAVINIFLVCISDGSSRMAGFPIMLPSHF